MPSLSPSSEFSTKHACVTVDLKRYRQHLTLRVIGFGIICWHLCALSIHCESGIVCAVSWSNSFIGPSGAWTALPSLFKSVVVFMEEVRAVQRRIWRIYFIGSRSSSSKNSISKLSGLWMRTATLVLRELLKNQIYVPSGSLVRHNMTSSEFGVFITVSLATWLRVCSNSLLFGAFNRSYQLVAVINFMTRNLILTASELASAESTPFFLRGESSNLSTFFCQTMYHLWYDIQWIERCVLSWGWTVAHFDNRLCHLRENIDIGVENAKFEWTYICCWNHRWIGALSRKTWASYRHEGSDRKWYCWYPILIMWLHEWYV